MTNNSNGSTPTPVRVQKRVTGIEHLYSCELNLNIMSATAAYKWVGPKLDQNTWWTILAFFEWTYAEAHSESQVRLFVNRDEWRAWAFPQKRGTGMTTTELPDHENYNRDRAQFGEGWSYYGTVHHHCSGGAFQSGTDEHNERDQDGLHITVGHVGGTGKYDLHCRMYQSGWKLTDLDMSTFWDIGTAAAMVPANMHHLVALHQMAQRPPDALTIVVPQAWKDNYIVPIVITPPVSQPTTPNFSTPSNYGSYHGRYNFSVDPKMRRPASTRFDLQEASKMLVDWIIDNEHTDLFGVGFNEIDEEAADVAVINEHSLEIEWAVSFLERIEKCPMAKEIVRLIWLKELEPAEFADFIGQEVSRRMDAAQREADNKALDDRLKQQAEERKQAEDDATRMEQERALSDWHGLGGCP